MRLLHRHDEQIEEIQKLTAELEKSPAFQKMREEQAAETLQKRQAAAKKIEMLNQEMEQLVTGKDDLEEKLRKMEAEQLKLQTQLNEKQIRLMQKKAGIEGQVKRERNFLYNSCDPKIDEVIEFFRKKLDDFEVQGGFHLIAWELRETSLRKKLQLKRKQIAMRSCCQYGIAWRPLPALRRQNCSLRLRRQKSRI